MVGRSLMWAMVGDTAVRDKGGKQVAEEDEVAMLPEGHLPFHRSAAGEDEDALEGSSMGEIQDVD